MTRLYAHRGASKELPENTLPAFSRALEVGANALEMDLHMSSDGHLMVSHDDSGERMAGVSAAIRSTSLRELKRWNMGKNFHGGTREQSFEMPTLAEVLREYPNTVLNIDLKQRRPSLVDATIQLIRKYDAEDRVILASFSLLTLLAVRRAGYRGLTALAPAEVVTTLVAPGFVVKRLPWFGSAAQIPRQQGPVHLDTAKHIARLHELGLRVDFWTINDLEHARVLVRRGADGIMTDDPRALAALLPQG